jgi:hypothetical protein
MDRLNAKAERLAESQGGLERIVEAAKPLYLSLDDTQKHSLLHLYARWCLSVGAS